MLRGLCHHCRLGAIAVAVSAAALMISAALVAGLATASGSERATVATAICPSDDVAAANASLRAPGGDMTLIAAGALSLHVCIFNGIDATARTPWFGLMSQGAIIGGAQIDAIVTDLDAIPPTNADSATTCPPDAENLALLTFRYASGAQDAVSVDMTGCQAVRNGSGQRFAMGAPVIHELAALTSPVKLRWPAVHGVVTVCTARGRRCHLAGSRVCLRECWAADRVTATNADGDLSGWATVRSGRFSLILPVAGRYTIRLVGDGKLGQSTILGASRVRVGRGASEVRVRLDVGQR